MWVYVAVFVVAIILALSLAPKPQSSPPAGLGEFHVPTAEEGREIPVLFGTRIIDGPNVVWYGDLRNEAIKKKS